MRAVPERLMSKVCCFDEADDAGLRHTGVWEGTRRERKSMIDERNTTNGAFGGGLFFDRFHLAGPHGPLRIDGEVVELPRKPLALLWTLSSRSGDVVTKEELLATVWPRVVVNEGAISACLRDLRRALGDDARRPRFIATAHGIGYRFLAPVTRARSAAAAACPSPAVPAAAVNGTPFVGRTTELARLRNAYARSVAGQRQLMFVSGDAGLGKSRLVDEFVSSLEAEAQASRGDHEDAWLGHGQCIEQYGQGEAYLPLLEAVTRLCRQPGGRALLPLLRRHAPTWLAQLPGLREDDAPGAGTPVTVQAGSVQRMLRELTEALDAAAARHPLVLVLEDMHWCDRPSVDWLAMWARRREPVRALIVATCRPVELVVDRHPLAHTKQEMVSRGIAGEIALGPLQAPEVRAYAEQRLSGLSALPELAAILYRRSEGYPLFMVHMADDLLRAGGEPSLDDASLAASVKDLIETQLVRLAPDQLDALEAASLVGTEFAAAAVCAALDWTVSDTEAILETLARCAQFIEPCGLAEWPDGTVSGRYVFRHALHRDVLRERRGAARRARLHRRIGERLSAAFGTGCVDVAAELANHFEAARDARRAAGHRRQAADKALRCFAYREALAHADQGLELLASWAGGGDDRLELELQLVRGLALLATTGYGTPEVESAYTRALALATRLEDDATIGPILAGLYNLYLTHAAFARVAEIADRLKALGEKHADAALAMLEHNVRGSAAVFTGDVAASLAHAGRTLALYDPIAHRGLAASYGEDLALASHHCAALASWIAGDATSAARHLATGFAHAHAMDDPFGEAQMLWMEALLRLDDGDAAGVDRVTSRLIQLCGEHDIALWLNGGRILRGGALAASGQIEAGRALVETGLQAWREAGTVLIQPYWMSIAARVEAASGQPDAALRLFEEARAMAQRTGERWYEAEIHRHEGETLLRCAEASGESDSRARACFERAIVLADQQGARLFEARARSSLRQASTEAARVNR